MEKKSQREKYIYEGLVCLLTQTYLSGRTGVKRHLISEVRVRIPGSSRVAGKKISKKKI